MLKVASYDVVFQEIPGEVTLALNLSGCPCHCKGCHSPHLWEDTGEVLDEELLSGLLDRYGSQITCVAFMGGDQAPEEVARWAEYITDHQSVLRTAWYSGRPYNPETFNSKTSFNFQLSIFNFIKFGPYIEALGGLKSEKTNQRLYKRVGQGSPDSPYEWEDITSVFWKKRFE